jgi:hypothetical protein
LGIDYKLDYGENLRDEGSVTVEGLGNYAGIATREFAILPNGAAPVWAIVEWPSSPSFEYTGNEQKPTATVSVNGAPQNVAIEGGRTNLGSHFAVATLPDNPFVILTNSIVPYQITPKPLAVSWDEEREFTFNRMVQFPKASVDAEVDLRVMNAQSAVGEHGVFAQIIPAHVAANYQLSEYSANYEIVRKPLEVAVDVKDVEEATFVDNELVLTADFDSEEELFEFIENLIDLDGFGVDTTGLVDRGDDVNVITGKGWKIRWDDNDNQSAPDLRSDEPFTRLLIIESEGTAQNYTSARTEILVTIRGEFATPIREPEEKDTETKTKRTPGIVFKGGNIVSDKAEIAALEGTITRVIVYDALGNIISDSPEPTWDLTNRAGRRVAEGVYVVVVEVKDRDGRVRLHSARLGVKR